MKIYYDIERIDKLLHDVHTISGLTLGFWDDKMNLLIAHPHGHSSFCHEIRSVPEGLRRCTECDRAILSQCALTHRACTRICHAGLPDSALPLYYRERLLGFITYGQLVNTSLAELPFEEVEARLSELAVDREALRQAFAQLPRYDDRKLEAVTTVVTACIQLTLLENIVSTKEDTRIELISDFIDRHLAEPISHDSIAKEFHLSRSTLYETFRRHFGMPVHLYIEKKRLERAAELLASGDDSILTVSLAVGIADQNYFARRFKKHFGVSPSEYRRSLRSNE